MSATNRPILSLTPAKAIVLIVLLGWLAYANSLTKTFLLDDTLWITGNDAIANWSDNFWQHLQRPVIALSLTLNYQIGRYSPAGYHLLNAIIHIAAALALFGVVRRTLLLPRWQDRWIDSALPLAFATAALWVVHPLTTHAVTYVIQRCESGMGLGFAFALYAMIRGSQSPHAGLWNLAAVLAAWIGVGCKEVMVTIIPVALVYDRLFLANSWFEVVRRRGLLHLGFASTLLLPLRIHLQNLLAPPIPGGMSVGFDIPGLDAKTYFLTQFNVILHYFRLAVWPVDLCIDYRDWPTPTGPSDYVPAGIVLTGLFLICVYGAWRRNGFAFLGLSVFFILSLSSSFVPLLDVANEYRMYVPLMPIVTGVVIGGYLLLVRLWPGFARQSLAQAAVLASCLACLVALTFQRNEDYRSLQSIWEDVLAKRPHNYKVYEELAIACEIEADWQKARDYHLKRLDYNPFDYAARANLGMLECREGRPAEGIKHLDFAFNKCGPAGRDVGGSLLALALDCSGRSQEAMACLDEAKKIAPAAAMPRFFRAGVLLDLGRADEARAELAEANAMFPDRHDYYARSARSRLRGRFGDSPFVRREALFYANLANAVSPKNAETLAILADTFAWNNRRADAVVALREAIALAGEQSPAQRDELKEKLAALEMKEK